MRMDTVVAGYKAQYISIVAPNPLNPTRDVLEIIYSIPDQTKVNIKILDESNRLVRFLIDGESRNANTVYCDKWDGTLTDGTLAANGMYFISLEISNTHREIYPVFVRK
jgi:flagellar hook assembly protein FlgD